MKQKLTAAGVLLLLLFLLKYPAEALAASREGLKLWLNTLLPTLLPFLILTGILLHTDGISKIMKPFAPFFKIVFGLSPDGAYVFLLGLLCGYPMGAKLAADLYGYGKLDKREAEYLLTFCNNPSPAFLTTYVGQICLEGRTGMGTITAILVLADMICMVFFRFAIFCGKTISVQEKAGNPPDTACSAKIPQSLNGQAPQGSKKETSSPPSLGAILDASIMNGFETMARLGGYILLFSILSACISHFWCFPPTGKYLLLGITELTTGLYQLAQSGFSYGMRFLCSMSMSAFGGLCIMAQTKSVLEGKLSLLPYASAKCMNAAVTAVLVLLL